MFYILFKVEILLWFVSLILCALYLLEAYQYVVFSNTKINVVKNHKYTFTFVQENLTTRALYINGALIQRTTGLTLDSIIFGQILMQSHQNGSYIVHSLRVYDKALSADEVLQNYNVDVLRFGN